MKIGILQCDSVRSTLSEKYGEYSDMIEKAVFCIDEKATFEVYQTYKKELPSDINECDCYIITGSRFSVFDGLPWITNLLQFINNLDKNKIKTIGFSFGHQIIAKALGGGVERDDNGWNIGFKPFETSKKSYELEVNRENNEKKAEAIKIDNSDETETKIKEPVNTFENCKSFNMIMMSKDRIKKTPEKALVVAFGVVCKYAVLQYENHFLTTQGHPEFSKEFAKDLLVICKKEMPTKRYEKGMATFLEKNANDDIIDISVFKLFYNFLKKDED